MKILKTNRGKHVYRVEENADGTLRLLSENSKHEVERAGQIIRSLGGIDRVLRLFNKVYFYLWPEKPDFGIGYTAVQYEDLEKEQLCTCVKFDEPVLIDGQQVCKVATGCMAIMPNGYLSI